MGAGSRSGNFFCFFVLASHVSAVTLDQASKSAPTTRPSFAAPKPDPMGAVGPGIPRSDCSSKPSLLRASSGAGNPWSGGGARTHASDGHFEDSNVAKESWLAIDLLFRRRLPFGLVAIAGPEAAYLLNGRVSGRQVSTFGTRDYDVDYTHDVKRVDLRFKVGVAYSFKTCPTEAIGHGATRRGC